MLPNGKQRLFFSCFTVSSTSCRTGFTCFSTLSVRLLKLYSCFPTLSIGFIKSLQITVFARKNTQPCHTVRRVSDLKSAQHKKSSSAATWIFCMEPNCFGVTRGEQPLVRASRASKVAGAFLVLFWHAKENLALLQNRSKPAPLARNFTAHFRAKNLTATCISHTPPASQSRVGYRNAPARGLSLIHI